MKHFTKYEIKWGLIFTVVLLLWMVFEKLMGWHGENINQHAVFTNFFAIPAILVYVLALLDKRKNFYHNTMTWKQGFLSGVMITLVVTMLSPVTQLIIHKVLSPEYFPNVIEHTVRVTDIPREEAEKTFSLGNYLWQAAISSFIMGVITSALVALFVKRTPKVTPEPA